MLGLPHHEVKSIKANYPNDAKEWMKEVVEKWLEGKGSGEPPSWKSLCKALGDPLVSRPDVAHNTGDITHIMEYQNQSSSHHLSENTESKEQATSSMPHRLYTESKVQSASSMPLTLYTGAQDPPTQLHDKEVVICPCMYTHGYRRSLTYSLCEVSFSLKLWGLP